MCVEKKYHTLILTLNGLLNEPVSQMRDYVLSDVIELLRGLQVTGEEYFPTCGSRFTRGYETINVPFHRTMIITKTL
jgi:hypothetical protein